MMTSITKTSKIKELEEQAINGKSTCIILARKNSSRLPHKNRLELDGLPLFMHSVKAAQASGLFDMILISSDDMSILERAYEEKFTIHKRPPVLARKDCQQKEVVRFLFSITTYHFGPRCCLLQATNPFVTAEDLRESYALMLKTDCNYVIAATEGEPVEYALKIKDGFIEPRKLERTQKYETVYYPAGSFFWFKPEVFLNEFDYGFYGTKCLPYVIKHDNVDVDTQQDFNQCKFFLEGK